ncbi:uncharacterized protein LOC126766026 [Bactrocera neohumeralis]|uniref:uncharacterized protein LOC126766026 n=1 Tax=Bactrocera neohumeralis TaxID=98809 RepID=UPI002165198B|nr:uncharacterized protein LOC126766026 [Bactrocera neohumeralis]
MYPVTIELGNKSTRLLVSALPTLSEHVILGMDFLRKRDLTITIDGQPLTATRLSTPAPTDHLAMLTESVDVTGSAARTRPRASKQPQEHSGSKQQPRPDIKPAELEALPRQTPLSTNARKIPTTRRVPAACEGNREACATTGLRAAQTSTHPVGRTNAQVTLSADRSEVTAAASIRLVQRGTAASTATAEASINKQLVRNAHEIPANTATASVNACSNDDGASAPAIDKTNVETTPPHPKATPTPTTTRPPTAEISAQPATPDTSHQEVTPVTEIPGFLEGLVMTRQHFIKRSKRTLFFRGRRLALQKLEGDRVLVRYGEDRCVLHLYE